MEARFALCLRNDECEDLIQRKIYQVLPDESAAKDNYIRIIDESGEDYLYPEEFFVLLELTKEVEEALLLAS